MWNHPAAIQAIAARHAPGCFVEPLQEEGLQELKDEFLFEYRYLLADAKMVGEKIETLAAAGDLPEWARMLRQDRTDLAAVAVVLPSDRRVVEMMRALDAVLRPLFRGVLKDYRRCMYLRDEARMYGSWWA